MSYQFSIFDMIYKNNDIFPNLILPYLKYGELLLGTIINKNFREFARETLIDNIDDVVSNDEYIKTHKKYSCLDKLEHLGLEKDGYYVHESHTDIICDKKYSCLGNLKSLSLSKLGKISDKFFMKDYSCLSNLEHLKYIGTIECVRIADIIFSKKYSCLGKLRTLDICNANVYG